VFPHKLHHEDKEADKETAQKELKEFAEYEYVYLLYAEHKGLNSGRTTGVRFLLYL